MIVAEIAVGAAVVDVHAAKFFTACGALGIPFRGALIPFPVGFLSPPEAACGIP